jgi:NADPH2:quinone reductase
MGGWYHGGWRGVTRAAFRDVARAGLIDLAGRGELEVPVVRTFPLADAREALELLRTGHPGGKLALIP